MYVSASVSFSPIDPPKPLLRMDVQTLIESMGQHFARTGRTPMRGRVLGYLLVADGDTRDFKSICRTLGASKSAVSLALTGLTDQGIVRAYTQPGGRKRYFEVDSNGWLERSKRDIQRGAELVELLRDCRDARQGQPLSAFVPIGGPAGTSLGSAGGVELASSRDDPEAADAPPGELDRVIDFHEGLLRETERFVELWNARHRQ